MRQIRKLVTVFFADVVDSTGLALRLGPDRFQRVMTEYFEAAKATVERHGGTVEKFIGDAVMAVFGIPELHEDDALRAVRAASEFEPVLEAINRELNGDGRLTFTIRCGIATGDVLSGGIVKGERLVSGDTVHVAARLQQAAPPGKILMSRETYRLVSGSVGAEPLDPLPLKGFAEPVRAFRFLELIPEDAREPVPADTPLVGRDHELGLLYEAYERVIDKQRCELFTILGSVGVGKTRLATEFIREIEQDARVLHGRCPSYGESNTFHPLSEIVKQALHVADDESLPSVRGKLDAAVDHRAGRAIAQLIGIEELEGSARANFWAVSALFGYLARQRPLVIVFDDIQWGERTFLELVKSSVADEALASILVVCVARTEFLELHRGWLDEQDNAVSVILAPLSDTECGRLVEYVLGRGFPSEPAQELIVGSAQGNPLFLQEMLAMLIDDGLLIDDDGRFVLKVDPESIKVPPSIQALLSARLDRLSWEERRVIEIASVIGEMFYRSEVRDLAGSETGTRISESLTSLVDKELVRYERSRWSDDRAYRFHHTLIREVAYERLALEDRARLHEAFARHLEATVRGWSRSYQELVGYHYERAGRYLLELGYRDDRSKEVVGRATDQLASAGRKAFVARDMPATVNLLSRAISLMSQDDPEQLNLLPVFADALAESGDHEGAYDVAAEAIERARAVGARGIESYALTVLLKLPRRPGFKISLGYGIGAQGSEGGFRLRS
jgi:class 3 adenylate cyclase